MERDITGRAVQQSARIVQRVMERVQQKVPLGPGNVKMTPDELKREVAKMRGEPLLRMAEMLGNNKASTREDLWPNLLAVHDDELGGDPNDFSVAKKIGLAVEDHLALHGIPKSSKIASSIIENFDGKEESGVPENHSESDEPVESEGSQTTLDGFS